VNHLEAQAFLSAAHDGEFVSEFELTAARAHCDDCQDCTAFAAGLTGLDAMPVTTAPDGLVERVLAALAPLQAERAEALLLLAEREEADSAGLELPVPEETVALEEWTPIAETAPAPTFPSRFEWFQGPTKWAALGAAAAFAATALVAFVVVGIGGSGASPKSAPVTAGSAESQQYYGNLDQGTAAAAPTAMTGNPVPAQAPDYVLYKDFVYSPLAPTDSASATPTLGTLSTAFATGGGPQNATVYRSPIRDGSIIVKAPDGYFLYTPVVRTLASVRYQLTSGKPLEKFGVWPALPGRFAIPAAPDGTPSFVAAGKDALSVPVFAAAGRPVTEGFAVAPGTAASDPAGGNPSWTWWAPAPAAP
jgi:hypothetical protein